MIRAWAHRSPLGHWRACYSTGKVAAIVRDEIGRPCEFDDRQYAELVAHRALIRVLNGIEPKFSKTSVRARASAQFNLIGGAQ